MTEKVYGERDEPKNLQRRRKQRRGGWVSWSENAEEAGALRFLGGHLEVGLRDVTIFEMKVSWASLVWLNPVSGFSASEKRAGER